MVILLKVVAFCFMAGDYYWKFQVNLENLLGEI